MVADFGLPLPQTRAMLELAGDYIDLGKIAVGSARLYSERLLREKLGLYKAFGVRPFIGGQFLEYVVATMGMRGAEPFFEEAARVGFEVLEVSDNTVPLTSAQRRELIQGAIRHGIGVFGEVGSKDATTNPDLLVRQAQESFEAGAELVLVEAAELVENGQTNWALIESLRAALELSRTLFELPGPWIKGVTLSDVYELKKFLIAEFGPDVNLANVKPEDIMDTETIRVGLGPVGPPSKAVLDS